VFLSLDRKKWNGKSRKKKGIYLARICLGSKKRDTELGSKEGVVRRLFVIICDCYLQSRRTSASCFVRIRGGSNALLKGLVVNILYLPRPKGTALHKSSGVDLIIDITCISAVDIGIV
jgi:hypothetical protein